MPRSTATSRSTATRSSTRAPTTIVYALDARTGKLVWETQSSTSEERAPRQTSGPIIANGKVISGRQCEPEGGPRPASITAHDAKTGKELWRTHTIPRPGEPGDETWGDVPYERTLARRHLDGAELRPRAEPDLRRHVGDDRRRRSSCSAATTRQHLYHNSTLALNADTGKIVWYYQHLVDHWDLDHPFERLLVDTAVAPDPREGHVDQPERARPASGARSSPAFPARPASSTRSTAQTGEFLWARPTVRRTSSAASTATGEVTVNPEALFTELNEQKRLICPARNGGKNWPAGAYSPLTNTMYYAAAEHLHDRDDDG